MTPKGTPEPSPIMVQHSEVVEHSPSPIIAQCSEIVPAAPEKSSPPPITQDLEVVLAALEKSSPPPPIIAQESDVLGALEKSSPPSPIIAQESGSVPGALEKSSPPPTNIAQQSEVPGALEKSSPPPINIAQESEVVPGALEKSSPPPIIAQEFEVVPGAPEKSLLSRQEQLLSRIEDAAGLFRDIVKECFNPETLIRKRAEETLADFEMNFEGLHVSGLAIKKQKEEGGNRGGLAAEETESGGGAAEETEGDGGAAEETEGGGGGGAAVETGDGGGDEAVIKAVDTFLVKINEKLEGLIPAVAFKLLDFAKKFWEYVYSFLVVLFAVNRYSLGIIIFGVILVAACLFSKFYLKERSDLRTVKKCVTAVMIFGLLVLVGFCLIAKAMQEKFK